jgi:hypothetical protein
MLLCLIRIRSRLKGLPLQVPLLLLPGEPTGGTIPPPPPPPPQHLLLMYLLLRGVSSNTVNHSLLYLSCHHRRIITITMSITFHVITTTTTTNNNNTNTNTPIPVSSLRQLPTEEQAEGWRLGEGWILLVVCLLWALMDRVIVAEVVE